MNEFCKIPIVQLYKQLLPFRAMNTQENFIPICLKNLHQEKYFAGKSSTNKKNIKMLFLYM